MILGDKPKWRDLGFKKYNFNAMAPVPQGGHLHPLLKVRAQFRKIFLRMGFEEMPTNRFVESSFWNFDALFQPQQHPARDAHDTFFLTNPRYSSSAAWPQDYLERVRRTHEEGGYGSLGYGYNWKLEEAEKNILRTHTTAVSSRMLYQLSKKCEEDGGKFTPTRYFSIDRVFRNESVDRTHLAEFHQCEGLVADRDLAHLIGTSDQFFRNIGIPDVKFKPVVRQHGDLRVPPGSAKVAGDAEADGPAGGRQGDQSVRCNTIQSSFPHPRLPAPAPLPTGNLSPNVIAQRDLSRL